MCPFYTPGLVESSSTKLAMTWNHEKQRCFIILCCATRSRMPTCASWIHTCVAYKIVGLQLVTVPALPESF